MATCDPNVLTRRKWNDFSPQLSEMIELMTHYAGSEAIAGTFKYKVFQYPGDVDLFERVEGCCSFLNAKLKASVVIVEIIRDIDTDPNMIITEFKAGYDDRFKLYTGVMNGGVHDYDPNLVRRDLNNIFEAELLTKCQYIELWNLIKDNPSIDEWVNLNEKIREYWVIRWTKEEVLAGYKYLPGNYKLYLDTALTQGSIVKLDVIAPVFDPIPRYIEMSNFFLISQDDKFGNAKILSEPLGDYLQSLAGDVYKYYNSNTLKAVKRTWIYLAATEAICALNMFTPLFQSEIARQAQIIADIETAIILLTSNFSYDRNFLLNTLSQRLTSLNGKCIPTNFDINNIDHLTTVKDCLQEENNLATKLWLKRNNVDLFALL